MRILLLLFMLSILPGVVILKAQPAQLFMPLQKPGARKLVLPATYSLSIMPVADSATIAPPKNYLPLNFYATHLGVACKMELQLEKGIKLPLRIRLGSKDQVDYLEGKYNHRQ